MKKSVFLLIIAFLAVATLGATQGLANEDFGGGEIAYKSVTFSHESHVGDNGFECDDCHDGIFEQEGGAMQGDSEFSMQAIYDGAFCGACHDGDTAFASDADCASCHAVDGGDIYFTEPVKSILFSHKVHGDQGLDCESCHGGLFEMKALAAQANADFNMAALYGGQYCGACHDGETAFASDTRCATCHIGVKGHARAHPERQEGGRGAHH